jgi:ATP-dependent Clp protease ATP-binding subunit ClpA
VIQREVVDRVAKAMIDGAVNEGDSVTVDIGEDGELVLRG